MKSTRPRGRDGDAVRRCGNHALGHDVHFIPWRLAMQDGPGLRTCVRAVDDDGTIHLAGGTTRWHHDPARLHGILARWGPEVVLASHGVLMVPKDRGAYCFSVSSEPDPCPSDPDQGGCRRTARAPARIRVGDGTSMTSWTVFFSPAVVLAAWSRRVAGWAMVARVLNARAGRSSARAGRHRLRCA